MDENSLLELFEEDLAQMRAGDIDGMLVHYHPDAQAVRLPDAGRAGLPVARYRHPALLSRGGGARQ